QARSHRVRAQPDEEPQPSRGRVPPHLVGAPLKAAVLGGGSSLRFLRQITQQGPEFFRDVGAEHEAKEPERPLHLDPLTHTRSGDAVDSTLSPYSAMLSLLAPSGIGGAPSHSV